MALRTFVRLRTLLSATLFLVIAFIAWGCASVSSSFVGNQTAQGVKITVTPTSTSVPVSGTQKFTASVANTSNTAVIWQVNGVTGGEATHALTEAEMPPHVHGNAPPDGAQFVTQGWAIGTQNVGGGNEGDEPYSRVDASAIIAVSAGGTGDPAVVTPHPIMPPWLSCFIYVRT